jgi:hypothetical protein
LKHAQLLLKHASLTLEVRDPALKLVTQRFESCRVAAQTFVLGPHALMNPIAYISKHRRLLVELRSDRIEGRECLPRPAGVSVVQRLQR